jgi:hypothetical protein
MEYQADQTCRPVVTGAAMQYLKDVLLLDLILEDLILGLGVVGRVKPETFPPLAGIRSWVVTRRFPARGKGLTL